MRSFLHPVLLALAFTLCSPTAVVAATDTESAQKNRRKPLQRCDQLKADAELECLQKARERVVEARKKRESGATNAGAEKGTRKEAVTAKGEAEKGTRKESGTPNAVAEKGTRKDADATNAEAQKSARKEAGAPNAEAEKGTRKDAGATNAEAQKSARKEAGAPTAAEADKGTRSK